MDGSQKIPMTHGLLLGELCGFPKIDAEMNQTSLSGEVSLVFMVNSGDS